MTAEAKIREAVQRLVQAMRQGTPEVTIQRRDLELILSTFTRRGDDQVH